MDESTIAQVNDQNEIVETSLDTTGSEASTEEAAASNEDNTRTETSDFEIDENPYEEASEVTETDDTGKSPDADKETEFDKDLDEWAEKTGKKRPDNDRERELLQEIRNGQREFHASRQAKKAADGLNDTISKVSKDTASIDRDISDPLEKDLADLKDRVQESDMRRLRSEFLQSKNVTESRGSIMAEIIKEKVEKAVTPESKMRELDYWSDPNHLDDLHDLAVARESSSSKEVEIDEATKKERDRIAKEHKASGQNRNAKTHNPAPKKDFLEELWSS